MMIEIQARLQHAAESILENEALSTDLDDQAAGVLLDWGVSQAQEITIQTLEMSPSQAKDAIYQPMRALRTANKWALAPGKKNLKRILKKAPFIYGHGYTPPDETSLEDFITQIPADPTGRLITLKRFLEGQPVDFIEPRVPVEEPHKDREDLPTATHKKIG